MPRIFLIFIFISLFVVSFQKNPRKIMGEDIFMTSQPSPKKLENLILKYKIRTVINLRGENNHKDWYREEKRILSKKNVTLYNIKLSASNPIPRYEILKLLKIFNDIEYPLLVHCKDGFDRSYFFLTLLMKIQGRDIEKRYCCRVKIWDFFKEYENYLKKEGLKDNQEVFYNFLKNEYIPEDFKYDLSFQKPPEILKESSLLGFEMVVKNQSKKEWVFKNKRDEGVRLGAKIFGPFDNLPENLEEYFYENEKKGKDILREGLWDGIIYPEEEKYFKFLIPSPVKRGKYILSFDMLKENVWWFYYYGRAPHFYVFEIN